MMLARSEEVGVGVSRGGEAARASPQSSRLPKPYNAATFRPKLSKRIPSIMGFS